MTLAEEFCKQNGLHYHDDGRWNHPDEVLEVVMKWEDWSEFSDNISCDQTYDGSCIKLDYIITKGKLLEAAVKWRRLKCKQEKKMIFEYCGFEQDVSCEPPSLSDCNTYACYECPYKVKLFRNLDGNDMVSAINKMVENKLDMDKYELDDETDYRSDAHKFLDYSFKCFVQEKGGGTRDDMSIWLFGNPDNFFKLMGAWLKCKQEK